MRSTLSVVKLGGSYAASPHLPAWLRAIEAAAGSVVLVPGGGPFADAVRAAQPAMGFDDAAAHDMALLAMAQYGRALTALGSGLVMADSVQAMHAAIAARRVPVWSPAPMLRDADIPASWSVTSDSLALHLARILDAGRVVLVKSRVAPADADPVTLVRVGLVDEAFPAFRAAYAGGVQIVGPADMAVLAFAGGAPAGRGAA